MIPGVMRPSLRHLNAYVFLLSLGVAYACGGSTKNDAGPSKSGPIDLDAGNAGGPSGLPCDVEKVLAQHCQKCHAASPQFGAPMPLMTWENLNARALTDESKKVYELIPLKINDDAKPMPPSPNERLSAADRKTLSDFATAGAPRGPDSCENVTPPGTINPKVSCTPDLTLSPSEPWEMPQDTTDEYVCWGIDLTRPTPTHITAFVPKIDNTELVHHVVMYEASSSYSAKPTPCSGGSALSWRMVLGWAPGAQGIELPPEAGFPIATTGATHYVVQMHYSNLTKKAGLKDTSKIELCTSPPRKFDADVMAFGTQNFKIPPAPPPGGEYKLECTLNIPSQFAGLHLFTAMPHMHKLGSSMKTELIPASGGAPIDLGTMPKFDFASQSWLPIKNAVTAGGDKIVTTCGWKNDRGVEVSYGEKTEDEMCYSFTMYYPRIQSALWSWAAPAGPPPIGATCVEKK
jgi:hypothetical protein